MPSAGQPDTPWTGPGEPQVYVGHRACPDTTAGCGGLPPKLEVYGILAPGWTREQLMQLLNPVRTERSHAHH